MADAESSSGKAPPVKQLARRIIVAQKQRVAQFGAYPSKHARPAEKLGKQ